MKDDVLRLTPEEKTMLRTVGVDLPPASGGWEITTSAVLEKRRDQIGSELLERVFIKIFEICRKEVKRRQRPHFFQWLPA